MSTGSAPAGIPAAASLAASTIASAAPPSWPWRRAALFLAKPSLQARLVAVSMADRVGQAFAGEAARSVR